MSKLMVRKEIREAEIMTFPPIISNGYESHLPEKYLFAQFSGMQPDEMDEKEYNTILVAPDGEVFLAMSIDFE